MVKNIITFCCKNKCPFVEVIDDMVILGDAKGPEGITKWTKENMNDFVKAAKEGKFDQLIQD